MQTATDKAFSPEQHPLYVPVSLGEMTGWQLVEAIIETTQASRGK
jgi:hypothetical protein